MRRIREMAAITWVLGGGRLSITLRIAPPIIIFEVMSMDSFISWIGGKKLLRKKIMGLFPENFERYIEVFGGAGWVLFAKDKHADMEVYNDVNGELVNLFRCVKHHPEALQKELEYSLISREQFFECRDIPGSTDIQRAAKFFLLVKNSYGTDLRSFGCRGRDLDKAIERLPEVNKRLSRTVIENKDFESLIKTYDRAEALFYLDPPYYEAEKYYPDRFNPDDHARLRSTLENIKGRFILSYNDCDYVRELYKAYGIIEVERQHNLLTRKRPARYKELIIKNY